MPIFKRSFNGNINVAHTKEDIEKIIDFRKKSYQARGRALEYLLDERDWDKKAIHLYAADNMGEIKACLRIIYFEPGTICPELSSKYHMNAAVTHHCFIAEVGGVIVNKSGPQKSYS